MDERETTEALAHYEGLIFTTAERLIRHPKLDGKVGLDDIRQLLRIKAWYALEKWSPERANGSRDAFIFACITNQVKDILKAKRPEEVFIEDQKPSPPQWAGIGDGSPPDQDRFEARYLAVPPDDVYRSVLESDEPPPLLPNTLTAIERQFVVLLYAGRERMEIRRELKLSPRMYDTVLNGIRLKFSDWAPATFTAEPELVEAA